MKLVGFLAVACALAGNALAPPPASDIVNIRQEFDRLNGSLKSLAGTDPKGKPPWASYHLPSTLRQVQTLQRSALALRERALAEAEFEIDAGLAKYADSDLRREIEMIHVALNAGPIEYLGMVGLPGAAKSDRMKTILGRLWDVFVLAEAEAKSLRK